MHKNTFFMTGGLSRGRWLGFSNVIQSFTQDRPCPSWAQEMACRVELPQSAVRKRCVRVVHQAFDSHKVNGPFSNHQSQSGYVSWDTSGDNPSIHSSARYSHIPQIQTPARIHFSTWSSSRILSSIILRCGTRLSSSPVPSCGKTESDYIYLRVCVCFRAQSIERCSQPASSPPRLADACSSLTPTTDRISPSATWHSSIWLGSAGGSAKKC